MPHAGGSLGGEQGQERTEAMSNIETLKRLEDEANEQATYHAARKRDNARELAIPALLKIAEAVYEWRNATIDSDASKVGLKMCDALAEFEALKISPSQ